MLPLYIMNPGEKIYMQTSFTKTLDEAAYLLLFAFILFFGTKFEKGNCVLKYSHTTVMWQQMQ